MTAKLDSAERARLRRSFVDRFSLDDLKDLAFDLGVDSDLFSHKNKQAFSRELIEYFDHRDQLGRLITEALKQRPDNDLMQSLAKLPVGAPSVKIQIIVSADLVEDISGCLDELAARFKVTKEEVVLIGAAQGSLRLLIGLPGKTADLQVLTEIHGLGNGKYPIDSIVIFDSLDSVGQQAWRLIARDYPPIRQGNVLRPIASWQDVLEATRRDRTTHTSPSERLHRMFPRLTILLVVSILVLSWGWFIGPIHGLLGLSVTTLTTSAFFFFVLWLGGPHVLPLDPRKKAQASAARNLVLRFASGLPTLMAVVREARILTPDGRSRKADEGIGVIDVDSSSVVVLNTETELSRIEGPGIIFTGANERIGAIVDLRVQSRAQDAELVTRDGIHVKVRVAVRFQIDQVKSVQVQTAQPAERWPMPYKWNGRVESAVKLALDQENAGPDGLTRWDDIVLSVATDRLRGIVAEYTFDDLSKLLDPRANPRQVVKQELENRVRTIMANTGIRVLGVGVGIFFPKDYDAQSPELDPISQQHVSTWRAKWQSQVMRIGAEGKAELDRSYELARSQAQMEPIMGVIQAVDQSGVSASDTPDQITQPFLGTPRKMEAESAKRKSLSEDENLAGRAPRNALTQESSRDGSEPSAEPE